MALIERTDAESLMPEEVSRTIIDGLVEDSAVMRLATRLPNMSRNQMRMPVVDALVTASFVAGDTGFKKTSKATWKNKFIYAEELAVIVPIPENVLSDADYDLWGQIRPRIIEAFGIAFDQAVLYGANKPDSWPDGLITGATAAGNEVAFGSVGDLYDDIMSENGLIAKVEEDGFMVNGHAAHMKMRARLRGLRDDENRPLFNSSMQGTPTYELDGSPLIFPRNGAMDDTEGLVFSGDWAQLVYTLRQDITWKMLTEATLYDDDMTTVLYALAQQDMVALRAVMRLGWQLPNPINRLQPTEASRYPFAVLTP